MLESLIKEKQKEQEESSLIGSIPDRFNKIYNIGESIREFNLEGEKGEAIETVEMIKESMKLINQLLSKGLSDPRLLDMNNRLLALTEVSKNVFDNPLYAREQKETAKKILEEAMRFRLLSRVDLDLDSSKEVFVEMMENTKEKEHRLKKIKNHHFFPTFAFGLSSIVIDCDLNNPEKEINVTLLYPIQNEEFDDEDEDDEPKEDPRYKQDSFEFFLSKDGVIFGEKGYDKVKLPRDISFIKLSEVMFDVSNEIERLSNMPSATVEYHTEEQISAGEYKIKRNKDTEYIPAIVDPVREKILVESAKKNGVKEIGVVTVKSISKLIKGGTKFNDYRLFLYDVGIVLLNSKIGNATYFSKINEDEQLKEAELLVLRDTIDNYNNDAGGNSSINKLILDYILDNMNEGFFQEGVNKLDLRDLPNVTTITHNDGWQARLESIFS